MANQKSVLRTDRTKSEDRLLLDTMRLTFNPGTVRSAREKRAFERDWDDRHDAAKLALGLEFDE